MVKKLYLLVFVSFILNVCNIFGQFLTKPVLTEESGECYDFVHISFHEVEEPDVIIRFTLDNTEVNENSAIYYESFEFRQNVIVRAKAFKDNQLPSEELIHLYNIPNIPQNLVVKSFRDSVFIKWTDPDLWSINKDNFNNADKILGYHVFLNKKNSDSSDFIRLNAELLRETNYNFKISEPGTYQIYVQADSEINYDHHVLLADLVEIEPPVDVPASLNQVPIAILLDSDPMIGRNLTNHSETINFTIKQVQNIQISPEPAVYFDPINITFKDTTADIHYTVDKFIPDHTSAIFNDPILLKKNSEITIIYRGYFEDYIPSEIAVAHYKITDTVKPPLFSVPTGYYFNPFALQIYCETSGVTIFYTTDGTAPNSSSKIYTAPISINKLTTIRAIAKKNDWRDSNITKVDYDIIDRNEPYLDPPKKLHTKLMKPFPNPFNDITHISYTLEKEDFIEIIVYNVLGQKITTLIAEIKGAGEHIVTWNGRCDAKNKVTPGLYFFQMITNNYKEIVKVVLTNSELP